MKNTQSQSSSLQSEHSLDHKKKSESVYNFFLDRIHSLDHKNNQFDIVVYRLNLKGFFRKKHI